MPQGLSQKMRRPLYTMLQMMMEIKTLINLITRAVMGVHVGAQKKVMPTHPKLSSHEKKMVVPI
jgi:hypothetical protein